MRIKVNEQRAQIYAAIKKRKNHLSIEKRFLKMWNGCTHEFNFEKCPKKVFLMKNNEVWFEQDFKNEFICCHYSLVWSVFANEFGMEYLETQLFMKKILEKHFKLGYLTPIAYTYVERAKLEIQSRLEDLKHYGVDFGEENGFIKHCK